MTVSEPSTRGSSPALLLLIPFLFSGAAALMAQMCWLRSLAVTMGGSSAALNIVLITFMGGLAIGARLAPALCRRTQNYLLFYAGLEGLLSVYLLFSPWVIAGLDLLFAEWLPDLGHETLAAHGARLVVAGTALSLPTIAMGLTTPLLLTAAVSRLRDTARATSAFRAVLPTAAQQMRARLEREFAARPASIGRHRSVAAATPRRRWLG